MKALKTPIVSLFVLLIHTSRKTSPNMNIYCHFYLSYNLPCTSVHHSSTFLVSQLHLQRFVESIRSYGLQFLWFIENNSSGRTCTQVNDRRPKVRHVLVNLTASGPTCLTAILLFGMIVTFLAQLKGCAITSHPSRRDCCCCWCQRHRYKLTSKPSAWISRGQTSKIFFYYYITF